MSFSLALSGASARGVAHLGVLKALDQFGYKPSLISGVSSGSIAGAFYALGYTPDEILEIILKHKIWPYLRPGWKSGGFFNFKRTSKILKKFLGEKKFEDLPIPLIVMATDFNSGQPHLFEKGPIIPAILASSAIPLLFEPIEIDGRKYLDGGILENIPFTFVRGKHDHYLAVDALYSPWKTESPGIRNVLERTIELMTGRQQESPDPSFLLRPLEDKHFPLMDLKKAQEMFEHSYQNALTWLGLHGQYLRE